ncbi:hypothetical protein FSPOR_8095 [Fusarium sporotrichioides]|uniref:Uncharacterized protein n=1 Tax=Fusarium sporotrichioides TaxID=5514 RepID=A0A395RW04_FUSSP|nr:hypothetical protein FSPOR_8095 [Fusarium sporotrichioides]
MPTFAKEFGYGRCMTLSLVGASKQKILLVQDPAHNWPTKRHVGSGKDGKLTYEEFMADLAQKYDAKTHVADPTLRAPGSDGSGSPSILEASNKLISKRYDGLLPVKFITPNEKSMNDYASFVSLVDQKFHEIQTTHGDKPEWKLFLAEKHERSTNLVGEINVIRKQETEEWIKKQMVTKVKGGTGDKKPLYGLELKESDLVTERVQTKVPGQTGTYERVLIAETWTQNRRNKDFTDALNNAGIKSRRDLMTWADNLGKAGNIGPNSPGNIGHFQTTQVWNETVIRHSLSIPAVARACNARLIMSNEIPGQMEESEQPYCIWHPDLATEDTYRALVSRFPDMRYQVGRACAVAGYHTLYKELDLLPEVSIAEEARESRTEGGKLIYDEIMNFKSRYAIMDDCKRSIEIEDYQCPAYLNGDTEVRWRLKARQSLSSNGLQDPLPCIEEDMHLDIEKQDLDEEHATLDNEEAKLLYQPLPQDLPTVKKTLLLQMAAYDGNIERFSQLAGGGRRLSELDLECVRRGILHHAMFARWWADQIKTDTVYAQAVPYITWVQEAIVARRIMVNDYAEFEKGWPPGVPKPYIIWWPLRPDPSFLLFLLERCPEISTQIAAAAIVCDYDHVYSAVDPAPSWDLWKVTMFSPNSFYREDQERRAKEKNVDFNFSGWKDLEPVYRYRDLMQTREFTVLEPYEGRIRDTVEEYDVPDGYEKILSTGDVQLKVWEGVGRVSPAS